MCSNASRAFCGFLNLRKWGNFCQFIYIYKGPTLKFFAILNKKKFKNFKIFSEPLKPLLANVTRLLYFFLLCRNLEKPQYLTNWTPLIYRGFQQKFRFSTTGYVKPWSRTNLKIEKFFGLCSRTLPAQFF